MKCPKCNFNLGETPMNYCPNCGKKVAPKEEKAPAFRNLDYLRLADYPRFKECLQSAPPMDSDMKAFWEWAQAPHEPVKVYVINASFNYYTRSNAGSLLRYEGRESSRVGDSKMRELLTAPDTYGDVKFSVAPIVLSYRFSPALMNRTWWWSEEEAIAFASEAILLYGGNGEAEMEET